MLSLFFFPPTAKCWNYSTALWFFVYGFELKFSLTCKCNLSASFFVFLPFESNYATLVVGHNIHDMNTHTHTHTHTQTAQAVFTLTHFMWPVFKSTLQGHWLKKLLNYCMLWSNNYSFVRENIHNKNNCLLAQMSQILLYMLKKLLTKAIWVIFSLSLC